MTPNLWNFQRVLTPLLQLKKFPDIPVFTREEARESCQHPEERRFRLMAGDEGSSGFGQDSRASSPVETGISGNFLSCSKGVKDPL